MDKLKNKEILTVSCPGYVKKMSWAASQYTKIMTATASWSLFLKLVINFPANNDHFYSIWNPSPTAAWRYFPVLPRSLWSPLWQLMLEVTKILLLPVSELPFPGHYTQRGIWSKYDVCLISWLGRQTPDVSIKSSCHYPKLSQGKLFASLW